MSGIRSSNNGAPKRRSAAPAVSEDDSAPPEKRTLLSASGERDPSKPLITDGSTEISLDSSTSEWKAYGMENVLDKLQLVQQSILVPDDDLTCFISDRPGFLCQQILTEDQKDLDTYFQTLDRCLDFDVMDAPLEVNCVSYQYGGYDRSDRNLSPIASADEVKAVFAELDSCFWKLERMPKEMMLRGLQHLVQYCFYAMDFIRAATNLLMSPTEWQERAFEDLFRVFCHLSGMVLQDGAREAPRHFEIFGQSISGKPDMRAYTPLEDEIWWRQRPVTFSRPMPTKRTLAAVAQVKLSPPNETGEKETEKCLGELVGEMLAELLSCDPCVPVAVSARTQMLGILVLSTKIYFVKLYIPPSLLAMYRKNSSSSCKDNAIAKGTVTVTQGFDFMKRKTRLQALKILHKIGTVIQKV